VRAWIASLATYDRTGGVLAEAEVEVEGNTMQDALDAVDAKIERDGWDEFGDIDVVSLQVSS